MVNSIANPLPSDVQFEKQLGKLAAFVRVMRQAGLHVDDALQMAIDDPKMRERLIRFWNAGGYELTESQRYAVEVMDNPSTGGFIGIKEAVRFFGVTPTEADFDALAEVPFTGAELYAAKSTHILVAVFPLSITDLIRVTKDPMFFGENWCYERMFANSVDGAGWHLIRKTPVENSMDKKLGDQMALLSGNEYVPSARVIVYAMICHYLKVREKLFSGVHVRCRDIEPMRRQISVGYSPRGIHIAHEDDGGDHPDDGMGLASAIRPSRE